MCDINYDEKIGELKKRLQVYAKFSYSNKEKSKSFINTSSPYFYLSPLIILFILFLILKPSFITKEVDDNGKTKRAISYLKLFLYTLILGAIIDVGIWAYLNKKI